MGLLSGLFGRREQGWVEVPWLREALVGEAPPVVVDVRNPDEFAGPLGHIDGAENIPLPVFEGRLAALAKEVRPVVLVCHTDRRSSVAASALRQAGGKDVSVLRGGMVAWRAAG